MNETNGAMRIIYLEAENVKRLKAVRIKPDKTLVRIEGRNAQGKSSVLDAIAAALGGANQIPEVPVRKGQKTGSVKLDLGSLIVERRWTAAGNTVLEVTTPEGTPQKSPQAILDKLVGDLTFDPLAFSRMKPKDQADELKRLAGLDFDALESEHDRLYAERTIANRNLKGAETRLGSPPPSNVPDKLVDVRALADKQQEAIKHNRRCDDVVSAIERAAAERLRIENQIATLNLALVNAQSVERDALRNGEGLQHIEIADLGAEIANAETTNRMIREAEAYRSRKESVASAKREAERFDSAINDIDAKKHDLLVNAKFPLPGLSIDANGPLLNGLPFAQASSSEQLRTSVAIAMAQKPKLRIMLIRDGSLLDGDGLNDLHKIAEEYDAQVFVERVSDVNSPSAVMIEDGEVVESIE